MARSIELKQLATKIRKYRKIHPNSKRYPEEIWADVIKLTEHYTAHEIAGNTGLHLVNIKRQLKKRGLGQSEKVKLPRASSVVKVPEATIIPAIRRECLMELEYPTGLKIRIYS